MLRQMNAKRDVHVHNAKRLSAQCSHTKRTAGIPDGDRPTLPKQKDLLLPESLDKDSSSYHGERVKRHRDQVLAQKGAEFEATKLRNLLANMPFNARSVVIIANLSEHLAQVPLAVRKMHAAGTFTCRTHYIGFGLDEKLMAYSTQVMSNALLDEWLEGTLSIPGGVAFEAQVAPLSAEEKAHIAEADCVHNLGALKLEVTQIAGARCIINPDQVSFWTAAPEGYRDEFMQMQTDHDRNYADILVQYEAGDAAAGDSTGAAPAAGEPGSSEEAYRPASSYPTIEALQEATEELFIGNTDMQHIKIAVDKTGRRWMWSERGDIIVPARTSKQQIAHTQAEFDQSQLALTGTCRRLEG